MLVSDKPLKNYEDFILEAMKTLSEYHHVKSIAIVALVVDKEDKSDEEEDLTLTGYHNMSLVDKQIAKSAIESDITDQLIMTNINKYMSIYNQYLKDNDEDDKEEKYDESEDDDIYYDE